MWTPKYRNWIVRGDFRDFVGQCMKEIAISNEFEIEAMQIAEDHVHIFLGFPSKYSLSNVVKRLKWASARVIFQRYPEVKRELGEGNSGKMDTLPVPLATKRAKI